MKKLIAILALAALILCFACGCEKEDNSAVPVTLEEAQQIALEEVGLTAEEATVHTHTGIYEETPCYSIHIAGPDDSYEVVISATTGEVLHVGEPNH